MARNSLAKLANLPDFVYECLFAMIAFLSILPAQAIMDRPEWSPVWQVIIVAVLAIIIWRMWPTLSRRRWNFVTGTQFGRVAFYHIVTYTWAFSLGTVISVVFYWDTMARPVATSLFVAYAALFFILWWVRTITPREWSRP
jgi:hypothetical protein